LQVKDIIRLIEYIQRSKPCTDEVGDVCSSREMLLSSLWTVFSDLLLLVSMVTERPSLPQSTYPWLISTRSLITLSEI
jgi:hypothetical protein